MDSDLMENYGFSTLHKAVLQLDCHDLQAEIKSHHGEIDGTDKNGNTALKWAAGRGDNQAVSLLLKAGANVNAQDYFGTSALHEAARMSHLQTVKILLEAKADPQQVNIYGFSVLHGVGGTDARNITECLIKAGAQVHARSQAGGSPLQYIVMRGDIQAVEALLDFGADIDLLDNDGDSALLESTCRGTNDTVELLLSRGAKYTNRDSNGRTLLHSAALFGDLRTLDILHDAKLQDIDPDALNREGQTALEIAQARVPKLKEFVEKLQNLLMDIRIRNADLQNPAQANTDEYNHMAIRTSRSHFVQSARYIGMPQAWDVIPTMVQVSLLLALMCLLCYWVYSILGLDWVAQSLVCAWNMISPDDFMEL